MAAAPKSGNPRGRAPGGPVLAQPWLSPRARRVVTVLAAAYALFVWSEGAGWKIAEHVLPLPLRFFVQEAELFPHAARDVIEWRAEAWRCDLGRFEELDVRPFFPIRRDDKESRFYRAMFFHYRQRHVLEALDQYLVREQNRLHPDQPIGGVMLLDLRVPIPPAGSKIPRYERLPLADYPLTVQRKYWYVTPTAEREQRCAELKSP
jgi:hypothetical protein